MWYNNVMKENNKDCVYYLAQNKDVSNLVFNNEVYSLEFVQIIGDMDMVYHKDYKKRDLFLKKHGKKLFRKFKEKKLRKMNKVDIWIRHERILTDEEFDSLSKSTGILTDEEIDSLLNSVDKNKFSLNGVKKIKFLDKIKNNFKTFYINCCEWKIIFSKNNIAYKFSLNGLEKIDYNKKPIEHKETINTHIKVLSQEEIDWMLTPMPEGRTSFTSDEFRDFTRRDTKFTEINVVENNHVFCSVDGVLFDKAMSELIEYPKNKDKTDYTVPDGIMGIAKFAFWGCKRLVNIVLPECMEIIQDYAFAYCEGLKTIILPMSLKFIGEGAFKDCPNLETVTLSRKTRIGHMAFQGFKGQLVYRD